ncbi:hypothetical protein GGR43_003137 [Sphingobium jiangsuense]|uniref:Acyl-CoA dehydrogenase n=2 Tax=Sphingobium jiangsuense TaxID=870476 RepID=A0A7W6BI86_9SPHN|nr:acyl-CoA dehydrogenase family protein [Sphingobium jiangsuense]MBB3927408.1 hypothetical protein [Sphingobium jiangsuense]
MGFDNAVESIGAHLAALPGWDRLNELMPDAGLDEATVGEILSAAGVFAQEVIEPFGRAADAAGCRMEEGRVRTAPGHKAVWDAFVEGGWPTLNAPAEFGGAGLPLVLHSACEELFNRASPAFGMLATSSRCAARLLEDHADEAMKAEWLAPIVSGQWGATICISEADAGSDVARIRTVARPGEDGWWRVTGEKMWITFGDQDLTGRIGHMLLARTPDAPPGTRGLSLFLVPSAIDGQPNGVVVRRIEEKLGLHASPTCCLGFEEARAQLIGTLHRGLPQLFTMIIRMRISVGSQGAALANAASDLAWGYAAERRQGGRPDQPPVTIDHHADVRRQLMELAARGEVVRGLTLLVSLLTDLADREEDAAARAEAGALLGWLLPITKNFAAEAAFASASEAIQVLGGAGYTREWAAEQHLRDARVLSIYEGTSGMQAQDLLYRRLLRDETGALDAFVRAARADIAASPDAASAASLEEAVAELLRVSGWMKEAAPADAEAGAYAYLQLASLAATGWVALRLAGLSGDPAGDPVRERLAARGRYWLRTLPARAALEARRASAGAALLDDFARAG